MVSLLRPTTRTPPIGGDTVKTKKDALRKAAKVAAEHRKPSPPIVIGATYDVDIHVKAGKLPDWSDAEIISFSMLRRT